MNLLEAYSNRLSIADKVNAKYHQGQHLTESKKILIAKCLENTQRFMDEALSPESSTQMSNMGLFKKFSLNLINVALPTLIAPDIVMTYPMSSMSGYINYISFTAGSTKGNIAQGHVFNDPFRLGEIDQNYTSSKVSSTFTVGDSGVKLQWTPIVKGTTVITLTDGTKYVDDGEGNMIQVPEGGSVSRRTTYVEPVGEGADMRLEGTPGITTIVVTDGTGAVVSTAAGTIDYSTGVVSIDGLMGEEVTLTYAYDNVVIPQNDIPLLTADMKALPLLAKCRRVAVRYSQMSAFQAKTDYGLDLGGQLADKAVGELSYEIDTEVTQLLIDNAAEEDNLVWSKTIPIGVSKADHYDGFGEIVDLARMYIYNKTRRFQPTYMLVSSAIIPVLGYCRNWTPAPTTTINGPYFAGTLAGLKVYVTPNIATGKFIVGVNQDDFMCSAAVYAPYMPIVPTQLLGFAGGDMVQGFSTLYDLRILNKDLLVAGKVLA